jgi:hypothetical protein
LNLSSSLNRETGRTGLAAGRLTVVLALSLASGFPLAASAGRAPLAGPALATLSTDPYTNTTSFHRTEVEPDTFAFGNTVVGTFQVGRFRDGGASNIGWATSTDAGLHWANGFLPGLTKFSSPAGPYDRASDPSVAYDARHHTWLIATLPITTPGGSVKGAAVAVNRSIDGGLTWGNEIDVAVATGGSDFDKEWIACDNTLASPDFGRCYVQWDDFGLGNRLRMSVTRNGGLSWRKARVPGASVIGGQPLAEPDGTVVVPISDGGASSVESFVSVDGGRTYTGPYSIAATPSHGEAGGLRSISLASAEVDAAGRVYVVWQDCRFRSNCSANDIVMSSSTDGKNWSAVARIPIDATSSGIDHFLPGLAVDPASSGSTARLGLVYHYYPQSSCSAATCQLDVGYVSSPDGGAHWTAPVQLDGPFTLSWLPKTTSGSMVGDYFSASFAGGTVHPVWMSATAGACQLGAITSCNEFAVSPVSGLPARGGALSPARSEGAIPGARSDHPTNVLRTAR